MGHDVKVLMNMTLPSYIRHLADKKKTYFGLLNHLPESTVVKIYESSISQLATPFFQAFQWCASEILIESIHPFAREQVHQLHFLQV